MALGEGEKSRTPGILENSEIPLKKEFLNMFAKSVLLMLLANASMFETQKHTMQHSYAIWRKLSTLPSTKTSFKCLLSVNFVH